MQPKIQGTVAASLFLTFLLCINTVSGQTGGTNSWIKPSSGFWEEPYWSLGQLPNHDQPGVAFNNPGWKALAIGANTTANFPDSLWIKNLLVESPTDSANQLLLSYAGVAVPLRIDGDLRLVGTNSSLVSYYSALQSGNFYLGGVATFDQLSQATFDQVFVGVDGNPGQLNLLSGTIQAGSLSVNSASTLNVANGCIFNTDGLGLNLVATGGVAVVNISGAVAVSNPIDVGLANITMSGGYFQTPSISVLQGVLSQSGGTNDSGAIRLPQGRNFRNGQATNYLSGGTLYSSSLSLGDALPGGFTYYNGVFEQSGGEHYNSAGIVTWGVIRQALRSISGTYRLRAGLLVTPSIQHQEGGGFEQSGGTNRAGTIAVQGAGSFALSGGSLSSSNTTVTSHYGDYTIYSNLRSVYTQNGGSHEVQSLFSSGEGGVAGLDAGWLTAPDISVGPLGSLGLSGAAVTNSGTFTILPGGRVGANGNYQQLGKLIVIAGTPPPSWPASEWPSRAPATLLNFGSDATTLRFRDSHDVAWDSTLVVTNWSGSPIGGGTHRLYVGTSSQGLTRSQLDLIRFANPAGLPAGNYSAVILATGEVVPTSGGQTGGVNSWTKPTSGFWEEASSWSLGVLPNSSQSVLITNQNWKAVAITPSTASNFPASMTVDSVTVRGAFDTFNTLLLQYVGTATPLTVLNGITLADMARILNFDSALVVQSGTIVVTNAQIVQDGGLIRTTNATMYLQNADYHLTNGVFEGGSVLLGFPVSARFNQYGGRAVISDLQFGRGLGLNGAGGTYSLYGGELNLPNGLFILGEDNAVSSYFQAGGTNRTTSVFLEPGYDGHGPSFTLNGGLLADNDVSVVADDFGSMTFNHNGGTHVITNTLSISGGSRHGQTIRPGTYRLNGGTLSARAIVLDGNWGDAVFVQSNGTTHAETIYAHSVGYYGSFVVQMTLAGGSLSCSNFTLDDGRGSFNQSGGALIVSNLLTITGYRDLMVRYYGSYAFTGGTLTASNINIAANWFIGDGSPNRITNPGTCRLGHALQIGNAVEQLGRFILADNATIDLAGSASRLSFANSSGQTWAGAARLIVANWNGNPAGGGAEQLKFGNNQSGLTSAQLSQIVFQIASNFYSAKILSTGELVPDQAVGAPITFSKQANNFVVTWPSGWFLQSATNVAGPYSDVSTATSPYSYNMTQAPQQFFHLRQ